MIVRCTGTLSNRSAIGTKIELYATINGSPELLVRHISSGNGWDGQDLQAYFGLGDAATIDAMFVDWPSGQSQSFFDLPVNVIFTFTEPNDPADVSIIKTVTPNPAVQGSSLTYTITIANNGPGTATNVKVTDVPPAGANFLFAFSSQGSCVGTNPLVCNLSSLAPNSSATVTILAVTTTGGIHPSSTYTITNVATLTTSSDDPNSLNNSATTVSTILTDSDADGLPDEYEDAHGLNKNNPNDGSLDSDGDGFNNLQEYLLGTDPQDPANVMAITETEQNGNDIRIGFKSVAGKMYNAQYCGSYPPVSWIPLANNLLGTGATVEVTDAGGASQAKRFYRITLVQ